MDGTIAGVDDAPATFGPDFTHGGPRVRHLVSGPERMWRAIKSIGRCNRTDSDRFKKNIVTGISTHAAYFSMVVVERRRLNSNVSFQTASIRDFSVFPTWH